jgi:transcriptional regulator with XRE-family HTH domain
MYTGKIIRQRREELNLSTGELAAHLKISEDYLKRIENETRKAGVGLLLKISVILDIPLQELIIK